MENNIFMMNHDELIKFKHELEKLNENYDEDSVRMQCVLTNKYPSEEYRQECIRRNYAYRQRLKIIEIINFLLKNIINVDIYRGADPKILTIEKIVENCFLHPLK